MTEEQKRQFSKDMRAYKEKKSQEVKEYKTTTGDIVTLVCAAPLVFLISMAISFVVLYVVFPILFYIFHPCDDFICMHSFDCPSEVYWITTCIGTVIIMIMGIHSITPEGKAEMKKLEEEREKSYMYTPKEIIECCRCHGTFTLVGGVSYTTCPYCRNRLHIKGRPVYDNLETDYYDEDMEGAPGYYGEE